MKKIKFLVVGFLMVSACTLAPKYNRPKVVLPLEESSNAAKEKIATIAWQKYFKSPDLQRAIQTALINNRDLRVANANIEAAHATYGVTRAALMPTVNATAFETRQGVPGGFASFTPKKQFRANLNFSAYEVDLFGRLRSLKEADWQSFLASEEARNVMKLSLIAETANAYAQLLLDRELLKISAENVNAESDRYKFVQVRYQNGIASQSDVLNSESVIEAAKTSLETYKKLVIQDENTLMLLMGVFDTAALPAAEITLNDVVISEDLLDFVPSATLYARPDIKQAEHELKSANANIGAMRAAFFPAITLTGNYGYASREMSNLFDSRTWSFTPQINMPLFAGGRNIYNLKLSEARKKVEIAQYEKAVQTAFREVSDQLAERTAVVNQFESYDKIFKARKKNYDILEIKHQVGISSALDVAEGKVVFYQAAQNQKNSRKEYLANLIMLYKVMGGGSEVE